MQKNLSTRLVPTLAVVVVALLATGATACGNADKSANSSDSSKSAASANPRSDIISTESGNTSRVKSSPAVESSGSRTTPRLGYKTFGPEANEYDKRRVTTLVKRYYAAAAVDDAVTACSLLYSDVAKSVPEDYGKSPGSPYLHGTTCPAVLAKLFKHRNGLPTPNLDTINVAGVRVNDDNEALALLRFPTSTYGEISLHREGGSWKVLQLLGGPLR
jgi:hypothetical protein